MEVEEGEESGRRRRGREAEEEEEEGGGESQKQKHPQGLTDRREEKVMLVAVERPGVRQT